MIEKDLLKILACPACKADVEHKNSRLICTKCKKVYSIKEDIPVMLIGGAKIKCKKVWEKHWEKLKCESSLFGRFCELYRKLIISHAVAYYLDKYFPKKGLFIEAGSGTSQTLSRLKKEGRMLFSVDIALTPLIDAKNENIDGAVCADILNLPFKDNSIDGIWNLGVMEHFYINDINKILNEFHRVLKARSKIILFWLPSFSSTQMVLRPVEILATKLRKSKFSFFPDEVTKLRSFKHARSLINKNKFRLVKMHFDHRDFFTYLIVVYEKSG